MHTHRVNVAIQLLPLTKTEKVFPLVDKAIEIIRSSGVKHVVCPFETVMEGDYTQIMNIVATIQEACLNDNAEDLIINLKIHIGKNKDIYISDKTDKYQ